MSTDHDLDRLDARGTTAGADLRARAAARPVPAFDPDRSPGLVVPLRSPARRGRTLAAVAAAVVLLAGGATWWAVRPDGNDGGTANQVVSGDPRPFVAGSLPNGLELYGAFELGAGESDLPADLQIGSMVLFGPDARHPELGIVPIIGDDGFSEDAAEVDLGGGRTGYRLDGQGLGAHALGIEVDGGSVVLSSATLAEADLIDLLPALHVDGLDVDLDLAAAPDGWVRLGEAGDATRAVNPVMALRGTDTLGTLHTAVYVDGRQDPAGDDADLVYASVASTIGDEAQAFAPAVLIEEREDVEVRGHAAVLGKLAGSGAGSSNPGWTVSWNERPGEVVFVSAYGLDRGQLLALAADVEPVATTEWSGLVRDTRLGELAPAPEQGTAMGRGSFDDDTPWVLWYQEPDPEDSDSRGRLDLKVDLRGGTSSTQSAQGMAIGPPGSELPPAPALAQATVVSYGDRAFAYGSIGAEAASVEVRRGDGTTVAVATLVEGDELRAYVVEVPSGDDDLEVVALDASGQVLDTSSAQRPEDDGVSWESTDISEEGSGSGTATTTPDPVCTSIVNAGGDVDECGQEAPDPILPGD